MHRVTGPSPRPRLAVSFLAKLVPTVVEGIWDREKVVVTSFPDEAAVNEWS